MNTYSLKNLSDLSRLDEQMIVLWNKKFKLFNEDKIDKNSLFNHDHLKKLIIISFLIESNKKNTVENLSIKSLSEIQILSEFEIQNYIQKNKSYEPIIELLICSCFSYDTRFFDTILTLCFNKIGIEKCCIDIVFPFLSKMSIILEKYTIQESVISFSKNLIRKHLFYLIKSIPYSDQNSRKWLLFLPEKENDDLELIYTYLLLKINNEKGIYLGENQSLNSILECIENTQITHIFIYISKNYDYFSLAIYLESIKKNLPNITIFVATYVVLKDKITEKVPYINVNNPTAFNYYLQKIMTM